MYCLHLGCRIALTLSSCPLLLPLDPLPQCLHLRAARPATSGGLNVDCARPLAYGLLRNPLNLIPPGRVCIESSRLATSNCLQLGCSAMLSLRLHLLRTSVCLLSSLCLLLRTSVCLLSSLCLLLRTSVCLLSRPFPFLRPSVCLLSSPFPLCAYLWCVLSSVCLIGRKAVGSEYPQ